MIRNFLLWLAVTDRDLLSYCTHKTVRMQEVLGTLVLSTSMLAVLSGGYTAWLFSRDLRVAALVALVYGMVIMFMDRFIVGTTNKWFVIARIFLAGFIGIVVSFPLETLVMQDRIRKELRVAGIEENSDLENEKKRFWDEYNSQKSLFDSSIRSASERKNAAFNRMNQEQEGFDARGEPIPPGTGPKFRVARAQFRSDSTKLELLKTQKADLEIWKEERRAELARLETSTRVEQSFDLLSQLEALQRITAKSQAAAIFSWLLRGLFILFELFPVIGKLMMDKNEYSTLEKARSRLNEHQINTIGNKFAKQIDEFPSSYPGLNDPTASPFQTMKESIVK
ncbi:MAG: DUF4407 domain-containing protein [Bacteroidota bacterium]